MCADARRDIYVYTCIYVYTVYTYICVCILHMCTATRYTMQRVVYQYAHMHKCVCLWMLSLLT